MAHRLFKARVTVVVGNDDVPGRNGMDFDEHDLAEALQEGIDLDIAEGGIIVPADDDDAKGINRVEAVSIDWDSLEEIR